jgi:hypothetical protein
MNTRLVVLLAALALPAAAAAQQGNMPQATLRAFHSDREMVRYLQNLEGHVPRPAPTPPAAPQPSAAAVACTSAPEGAAASVTGRVANAQDQPEAAVLVRIESLNAGVSTGADGTYRLVIPGTRICPGQPVRIIASRQGLAPVSRSITLSPGAQLTQNFQMSAQIVLLEDVTVTGTAGAAESITNNQQEGVDEGGIVKRQGDYLVILRRGRLFTVDVGGGRLRPVSMINAFGGDGDPDAWYDEMLVSGETVVVIGYSDKHDATEIGLFRIDHQGGLHYRETWHMRSGDYYSSRDYASRLIGTRLVMYAPVEADAYDDDVDAWMPGIRRWRPGDMEDHDEDGFRRILRAGRVYGPGRPLSVDDYPVLHTVTSCELGRGRMDCQATAVLGPEARVFYVSPTAAYVWTSDWMHERERAPSTLYRIPLDGSAPAALAAEGGPVDQFSFLESGDGHLNVLVRSDADGEAMWQAEDAGGDVRLLRVPLSRFGGGHARARDSDYRTLPVPAEGGYAFHNRFVGRHLLYGTGGGWDEAHSGTAVLYALRWDGGRLARVALPHGVDRIEVMGGDAVVVGADSADLHFSGIRLGRQPRVAQRYVHPDAQQGELRSHGFFYRADAPDRGVIGLPIVGPGKPGYTHLFDESASVLFVQNQDSAFRPLGELKARPEAAEDDGCIASCVDWYGNSRPIFLGERILALMGYEIVEGAVVDGRIREVRRAGFAPQALATRN